VDFAQLRVGDGVHAHATMNGKNGEKVELSGTLSAKAGTAACGTLTNGDRVEVEAARQSNGTVLATRVEKKK